MKQPLTSRFKYCIISNDIIMLLIMIIILKFLNCFFLVFTDKQHLLAVGDNAGTLHILEIPWSLRLSTPNEV